MNHSTLRDAVVYGYMIGAAAPRVQVEMPINACPDDDPIGEQPTEMVWATDVGAVVDLILKEIAPFVKEEK